MVYIGETKRSSETRKKNILEISDSLSQNPQTSKITLQHLANTPYLHHDIDWNNSQILKFETDYRKRRFIESFFSNNVPNTMNDRKSISLPCTYFKLKNNTSFRLKKKKLVLVSLEPGFYVCFHLLTY